MGALRLYNDVYIAKQVINITEKLAVIFMINAIIKNVRQNSRYIDGNDNDGTSRHLICGGKNITQSKVTVVYCL